MIDPVGENDQCSASVIYPALEIDRECENDTFSASVISSAIRLIPSMIMTHVKLV